MRVYKIIDADTGTTWVAAETLEDAFAAIPDWHEDHEAFPMRIEICEPEEVIEVVYEDEPPPSFHPQGHCEYEEGRGLWVASAGAQTWADWAEATGEAQAFGAERWAP